MSKGKAERIEKLRKFLVEEYLMKGYTWKKIEEYFDAVTKGYHQQLETKVVKEACPVCERPIAPSGLKLHIKVKHPSKFKEYVQLYRWSV